MTASKFVLFFFFFSKAEHHRKAEQLEELGEDGEAFLQKLGSPTIPTTFCTGNRVAFLLTIVAVAIPSIILATKFEARQQQVGSVGEL